MPQGLEHVEEALRLIQRASEAITKLESVDETRRAAATARLAAVATLLRATTGRFFLKTKLCLPFARKCEEEATKLDALLAELSVHPSADAQSRLNAALEGLEKATRTLDERSKMQGMAIT